MRIGIEARWITHEKTGFGNYAVQLLRNLSRSDRDNEYAVYTNSTCHDDQIFRNANFSNVVLDAAPAWYKHVRLPLDLMRRRQGLDLFHFLYNSPPLFFPCDYVLTIHDLSYRYVPQMISLKDYLSINVQLQATARKARRIIAVSENTKTDIIKFLNIPEHRIEVIHEGVGADYRPVTETTTLERVRRKYHLPEKFMLYVGTYLPHKNIDTLLLAYRELLLQGAVRAKLVLAGKKGRNSQRIEKLVAQLDLQSQVVSTGFVAEEDLPALYSMSEMFLFPSLYEGFGLPILEAMACGVPVALSSASCHREIAGDAALYFPATDPAALAGCMGEIASSIDLQRELKARGMERARSFTWESMAEKTRKLYEVVGRKGEQP